MYIKDEVALRDFKTNEDRVLFNSVYSAFTNRGLMHDDKGDTEFFELKDLITTEDLTRFIPQTVETVIREAIEPNLFIVDKLFQTINIPRGSRVQIGAIGAMEAGRVGQGGEYPERFVDMGEGDMISLTTDKHGLKISLTEEVLRENLFDVVGLWLRAAGRALARHKERTAAKLINEMGYDVFDNKAPSNAYIGTTTGRNIAGLGNGSMTVNDVFEMYTYLLHRGFNPDTLMMHPLAWKTFMTDSEMREVVLEGATVQSYRLPKGNFQEAWGSGFNGMGIKTSATGNQQAQGNNPKGAWAWTQTLNPLGATFNIAPRYLPTPLEVLVTQYVPFQYGPRTPGSPNETTKGSISNIIMVDSSNCGLLGQSMTVTMDRWTDPERDIENIKLKEMWGLALLEQGKGIAVARNISSDRNYGFQNVNQQNLSVIDRNTPPSGLQV